MQWPSRDARQWPSIGDVAVTIVVTALSLGASIGESHPTQGGPRLIDQIRHHQPGPALALVVAGSVALLWRRLHPRAVLGVALATTAAYAASGYVPGGALLAVYVALYSLGRYCSRREAIVGAGASILVMFLCSGLGGPFGWLGGTNTVMVACSAAATAIGMAVAARRRETAALLERAELAERDREEEARRRVDAERLRIARELHDVVAHSMSMINIQAGVAAHVLHDQPEQAVEALAAIKVASRDGLRELRAILNVLRQVDADGERTSPAPGIAQLEALVAATNQAGLVTTLKLSGRDTPLAAALELAIFRIVQESLTNVLRHAGPDAHAAVHVAVGRRKVLVQVDDDGRSEPAPVGITAGLRGVSAGSTSATAAGAARLATAAGTGTGIAGMRERAAAFGGTLRAGPIHGGGWRVRALLPIPEPDS